jgi:multiple antibiotic resistance protein
MLFISIIALFPVINPLGSALIVNPYLSQLTDADEKIAVKKITFYAFSICVTTLFVGHWILELFGISIPVIQLAGGIMICKMGWEALSANSQKQDAEKNIENLTNNQVNHISDKLFYPLTFPITTGAGTLSVLFTLSANSADTNWLNYLINTGAILLAIIFMCLLIYGFYGNTKKIVKRLGNNGQIIANRIIAFLIFCVGLQIAVTGIKNMFGLVTR